MGLKLQVISFKNQPLSEIAAVVIDEKGGSIGRADDNALVLPDQEKFVSRHHAYISYKAGTYYLSDTSLAGIYIDNQSLPLHNTTEVLENGNVLKIGEYQIEVSIAPEQILPESAARFTESLNTAEPVYEFNALFDEPAEGNFLLQDQEQLTSQPFAEPFNSGLRAAQPPLADSYIAPAPVIASQNYPELPEQFSIDDLFAVTIEPETAAEPLAPVYAEPVVPTAPEAPEPLAAAELAADAATEQRLFRALMAGLGVPVMPLDLEQQEDLMNRVGQMFRTFLNGTVAVLRGRAEFKSLSRVNMTVIKSSRNNPLKFTITTQEVLRQLLENNNEGFLESTAAIEEAFADLMNHQLAMQAGIQASLSSILKTLSPKLIEQQFSQGIVLQKKARCWEKYEETYPELVDAALENFFGEAFVKAYEKQLAQLNRNRSIT